MTATVLVIFKTDASDLQIYLLSFSAMVCLALALEFVNGCDQAFILVATKLRTETMTAGRSRISHVKLHMVARQGSGEDELMRTAATRKWKCATQKFEWQTVAARASGCAG